MELATGNLSRLPARAWPANLRRESFVTGLNSTLFADVSSSSVEIVKT
jgi:hypothetical protein